MAGADQAEQTPQAPQTPSQTAPVENAVASPGEAPEHEREQRVPGFGERGRMRRRARYLRRARELAYRDLGGLVFDLHRFGQRNDSVVLAKLNTLNQIDTELRALEDALDDRRPVTVLHEVGIAACPRCAAIHGSDDRFCPGCGLAFATKAERPISTAPVTPAPVTQAQVSAPATTPPAGLPAPALPSTSLHASPSTPTPPSPPALPASPSRTAALSHPTAQPHPASPSSNGPSAASSVGRPPASPPASPPAKPAASDEDEPTEILRPPANGS